MVSLPSPDEILNKVQSLFPSLPKTTAPAAPTLLSKIPQPTTPVVSPTALKPIGLPNQSVAPSPFVAKTSELAGKTAAKIAPAITGFVVQQGTNVLDALKGKLAVTPDDLLSGVKQTANGVKWLAQGINEGVVRLLQSTGQAIDKTDTDKLMQTPIVQQFNKAISGKDQVISYQDIYKATEDYAKANQATPKEATSFASLAVLGMVLSDNPVIGAEAGGLKFSDDVLKELAETTDEKTIVGILQRENNTLTQAQSEALAPVFKAANTPQKVRKVVQVLDSLQPESLKAGYLSRPTDAPKTLSAAEILQKVKEGDYSRTTGSLESSAASEGSTGAPSNSIDATGNFPKESLATNELPSLRDNASSAGPSRSTLQTSPSQLINFGDPAIYKDYSTMEKAAQEAEPQFKESLEEALGKPVDDIRIKSEDSFDGKVERYENKAKNKPITDMLGARIIVKDSEVAHTLAKLKGGLGSKIQEVEDRFERPSQWGYRGINATVEQPNGLMAEVQIHTPETLAISKRLHPIYEKWRNTSTDELMSDPTLKDAYTKDMERSRKIANDILNGSDTAHLDPGFRPELIKTISNEKAPGVIADTLTKEFPKMPRSIIYSAADRLKNIKRTADIEGILSSLARIHTAAKRTEGIFAKSGALKGNQEAIRRGIQSVEDVMEPAKKEAYLRTVTESIKDRESAVLAQQEYEALWSEANQNIIDTYEQTRLERDFLREALDNNPAAKLFDEIYKPFGRSPSDPQYSLQDIFERAQPNPQGLRDSLGKEIVPKGLSGVPREKLVKLDETVHNLGFKDFDEAQEALESHEESLQTLDNYQDRLKGLRPQVQAARILQDMIDDVPIVARARAGEIDAIVPDAETIEKTYKDISGFQGQARDVYRNFERFFGPKFEQAKKAILDPFDRSKGDYFDEMTQLGNELDHGVVKRFGIERGSRESAAIQRYGDAGLEPGERMNYEQLVKTFGRDKATNIVKADGWFKETYNRLIDEANGVLEKIYPNNPNKLIQKRADYYRHFRDLGGDFHGLIDIFETPKGINPQLAGLSEFTAPKSTFLSFAQKRLGKQTDIDAIGGFLDYAKSLAYLKHIDPHIGTFRYLRKRLAESAPMPGVFGEKIEGKSAKGINNFLEYLNDFANDLAGKTNPADRWLQKVIPGGRKTFQIINWINRRTKANVILGNLSSALAQIANVPQGIASAKFYSVPGLRRSLASIFVRNEPMEASAFLKERYATPLGARFKIDWAQHPIVGGTERATEFAAWITQALDEVGTKFIWNSHYAKALAEKSEDPVKYADDITRRMVAGRGIGEVPLGQKSKIAQLIIPFQVEVGNAWHVMSDFVRQKDFGALATFFVASYLLNRAEEKIRGTPVIFDPIQATINGATDFADEMNASHDPWRASFKFLGREMGEMLSNLPGGQTVAAAVPDDFVKNRLGFQGGKAELFGSSDPGRYGSGLISISSIEDPLTKLIPPFGGTQAVKTYDAIKSMLTGSVMTNAGQLSFKTPTDPFSVVQALLFGKNATAEAQQAYSNRDDLFQRVYRQEADRSQSSLDAEKDWADIKATKKASGGKAAAVKLAEIAKKDPTMGKLIVDIADQESKGLDGTDRLIALLGVQNGERAKYIVDTIKPMSKKDRLAYIQSLASKKLLTDDVIDQMTYLLQQK